MKYWSKIICIIIGTFIILMGLNEAKARSNTTDWYIKTFDSQIIVNKDSTLNISESILADCGNAPGKHGIFRILPLLSQKTAKEIIKTPIQLKYITDFQDKGYNVEQSNDSQDKTMTWKIGDPNITVKGENGYKILYIAKNVIRSDNPGFDELYWNLNGNFWELETDKYTAEIIFPIEVTSTNAQVNLYSGNFGQKDENLASYKWNGNILIVESKRTLQSREGITISVTMPKGIFTPYTLTSQDEALYIDGGRNNPFQISAGAKKLLGTVGIIWPIFVFAICFWLWSSYGKDPKINRAVAPEFEIPENLSPLEMGMIDSNGKLLNHFISATIVNLAVKNYIAIEVVGKTGIFTHEDYKLKLTNGNNQAMNVLEELVCSKLFDGQSEIFSSKLKNKFYVNLPLITRSVNNNLKTAGMIKLTGNYIKSILIILSAFSFFAVFLVSRISETLSWGLVIGGLIIAVFAFLMPARTQRGAELEMRIKGFKMYLETAEKYRQQFNEKENIFEKFLPYAMIFHLTNKWIDGMKNIYGEEYFNTYQPMWLHGMALTGGHFNMDSFSTTLESLSSNMASTIASSPSSSGAGGGGFSGGGGGGGGGGGW